MRHTDIYRYCTRWTWYKTMVIWWFSQCYSAREILLLCKTCNVNKVRGEAGIGMRWYCLKLAWRNNPSSFCGCLHQLTRYWRVFEMFLVVCCHPLRKAINRIVFSRWGKGGSPIFSVNIYHQKSNWKAVGTAFKVLRIGRLLLGGVNSVASWIAADDYILQNNASQKEHSSVRNVKLNRSLGIVCRSAWFLQLTIIWFHQTYRLATWLMEPGGSMPHSQGLSNNTFPEPNQPNSPHWYLSLQGPF